MNQAPREVSFSNAKPAPAHAIRDALLSAGQKITTLANQGWFRHPIDYSDVEHIECTHDLVKEVAKVCDEFANAVTEAAGTDKNSSADVFLNAVDDLLYDLNTLAEQARADNSPEAHAWARADYERKMRTA